MIETPDSYCYKMPRNRRNNAPAVAGAVEPAHVPVLDPRHQEMVEKYRTRRLASQYSRLPRESLTAEQIRILLENLPYSTTYPRWAGLWRSSADEATPIDAYPQCLQVFPELLDGATTQGNANRVWIRFIRVDANTGIVIVRDNGRGIQNWARLKEWAAAHSVSNIHRNGHGVKKGASKFTPDYDTAEWKITSKDGPGRESTVVRAPFCGEETHTEHLPADPAIEQGTEIAVVFEWGRLGKYMQAQNLLGALKEIICTRYDEDKLRACRFEVTVEDDTGVHHQDSHAEDSEWHSLEWYLGEIEGIQLVEHAVLTLPDQDVPYEISWYYTLNRRDNRLAGYGFPNYGKRTKECALVHTKLNGRLVEAIPFVNFSRDKGRSQDSFNGNIVFVNFTSPDHTKMPPPCTTKVSLNRENPIFKKWFEEMQNILNRPIPAVPAEPRQRAVLKTDIAGALRSEFHYDGDVLMARMPNGEWYPVRDLQLVPRV